MRSVAKRECVLRKSDILSIIRRSSRKSWTYHDIGPTTRLKQPVNCRAELPWWSRFMWTSSLTTEVWHCRSQLSVSFCVVIVSAAYTDGEIVCRGITSLRIASLCHSAIGVWKNLIKLPEELVNTHRRRHFFWTPSWLILWEMDRLEGILNRIVGRPSQNLPSETASHIEATSLAAERGHGGPVRPRDIYRYRKQRGVNLGECQSWGPW